jgi:hypothetical protein
MDRRVVYFPPVWGATIITIVTFALTCHVSSVFRTPSRKQLSSGYALPVLPVLAVLNVVGPVAWILAWKFDFAR